jgi:EpsD family peptidyl-prolyl cis-trans isomerase
MKRKTGNLLILASVLSLTLSACGEKKPTVAAPSNVAVKVNGQAISVAEIDAKSGHGEGSNTHAISGAKLKSLVEMELLRQAAVQTKLDADENVRARIANSTRTILAMAYMEKQLAAIGKPTESDIKDFFNQNPARFAERKEYAFQEFSIQAPPGKAAEIQAQLGKVKNFQEFDQWLTGNNIPHGSAPVSVTSDRLPEDVLQKVKNVPVGGTAVVGGNEQMNVIFVLGQQSQPITLEQAAPMIPTILTEKRRTEALENMMKQVRDKAKVEYVAPYTANGYTPPDAPPGEHP